MRRLFAIILATTLLSMSQAQAHSGGHGLIEPTAALTAAVTGVEYLTRERVDRDWSPLDPSWAKVTEGDAKILAIVDGDFVVSVTNADGRVFYILIGGDGGIVDANFTGLFPYVYDVNDPSTWTTD